MCPTLNSFLSPHPFSRVDDRCQQPSPTVPVPAAVPRSPRVAVRQFPRRVPAAGPCRSRVAGLRPLSSSLHSSAPLRLPPLSSSQAGGPSFSPRQGSLTVFFVGSILLTVPIYDRIVVLVARRLNSNPHGLTPLQRIGAGRTLSVIAMAGAALTEIRPLRVARDEAVPASGVFFLVGASEAFTYIGQLDFFLRECPKGMKTMSTGLFLSTV
ncbi:protein NRT1/ PTR FAMILY 6.3-like [Panicum miliaceum]|uniref:Protein NRT1/ PTR FAMILY 6.3-like n=1 Tax=Panicum miliaceum TaxID=4540 RepID=A0A3L6PJD5_PANMI|nr:protein NRT1/ PTR FAMILY 6.3-like [Panicum miliaceum]